MSDTDKMTAAIAQAIAQVLRDDSAPSTSTGSSAGTSSGAASTSGANTPGRAPYPGSPGDVRALVFFTAASIGFDESIEQLRAIQEAGITLEYTYNEAAKSIIDRYKLAQLGIKDISQDFGQPHDMLIMPNITVNTMAKVAHGIADSAASNVVSEFIMLNRPVVMAKDAACPNSAGKRAWFPEMPEAFGTVLLNNIATVASFGVTMVPVRELAQAVLRVAHKG